MPPKLSLVIVNYNTAAFLDRALVTFAAGEMPFESEVIVIDNGSVEPVEEVCARHSVRLMRLGKNRGYGAAANRAAEEASGEYLAVANPDIAFGRHTAVRLVDCLDTHGRAGVVGPQLVYPDGTAQPSARRYPRLRYILVGRRSPLVRLMPQFGAAREFLYAGTEAAAGPVEVEAVLGTCMVFRRCAFDEVGGFDESYFLFAEDMDICRRLALRGWQSFVEPAARLEHYYGGARRRHRLFSEQHRVQALVRFLGSGLPQAGRGLLAFGGVAYCSLLAAGDALGLYEFEYSWAGRKETRRTA
uniref:Glycosyltransferase family 2 protein n=1 Tax=candidate division WOR-3 bacterium TaxID=2052148 RepID=A0A7C4GAR3_UNCW3